MTAIAGWGLSLDGAVPFVDVSAPPAAFTASEQGSDTPYVALTTRNILNFRFLAFTDDGVPYVKGPTENGYTMHHTDDGVPYVNPSDALPWARSIGPDIGDPVYAE